MLSLPAEFIYGKQLATLKVTARIMHSFLSGFMNTNKDKIALIGIEILLEVLTKDLSKALCMQEAKRLNLCVHINPRESIFMCGFISGVEQSINQFYALMPGILSPRFSKSFSLAMSLCLTNLHTSSIDLANSFKHLHKT